MGAGTFDPTTYRTFTDSVRHKHVDEIYSSRLNKNLDPLHIKVRESRDSASNPQSTPVIIALDVTGSMGMIASVIAKEGLGTLFTSILDRKPISDPHVMFMGVGDANCDSAPLQVSQFEADKRIIEQLTQIYLEGGGGGNNFESYNFPWYFASEHTVHDSYEKRAKRGYLFTVGDEESPKSLTKAQIKRFIGDDIQEDISPLVSLEAAQRYYDVFHVVIKEGDHARSHFSQVMESWNTLLGQHTIPLADHTKLAETIVSAIEIAEGLSAKDSASRWTPRVGSVVYDAVQQIPTGRGPRLLPGVGV
ncbi:MAG TPA: hypothetical protein VNZ86_06595 [Bacteroidia bacterium]|jgi:hypothetical protein|nr:hypothetical protein [Bacteroidia bacterium]